jgi:hypothetical protein
MKLLSAIALLLLLLGCSQQARPLANGVVSQQTKQSSVERLANAQAVIHNKDKVIHVLVALCDNEHQGIVPVPAKIGNGDDPAHNLYWGAGFGVKTFFSKSRQWQLVAQTPSAKSAVLERLIFKHKTKGAWLVADAYRGSELKQTIRDLLNYAAGKEGEGIQVKTGADTVTLGIGSNAELLAFVGHNGLMDFTLYDVPPKQDDRQRAVIILCCISKRYFANPLKTAGGYPLLWTTGLMAPEAYVLQAAVEGWLADENGERIRERAAIAYNTYQKCGLKGARNLFATGW